MSGRKIQKKFLLCPDYIRHTPFLPKFVWMVHQGLKIAKSVQINPSGFENHPGPSGMAYRSMGNHLGTGDVCNVAYTSPIYSTGPSPEPPASPSLMTVFLGPFLLAALRDLIA